MLDGHRSIAQRHRDPLGEPSCLRRPRVVIRHEGRGFRRRAGGTGHQVVVEGHHPLKPQVINLGQELGPGPVVLQPHIGSRTALAIGGLGCDASPGIRLGQAPPDGEARHTSRFVGPDDHGEVISRGHALLDEQGHVVHHNGGGQRRLHQRSGARTDQWVGDGLEILSRPRVGKDDLTQRTAIQGAVGRHHSITEALADRRQSGRTDCHDLSRQPIGIDDDGAELPKPLRHRRFAGTYPASEPYAQHVGSLLPAQTCTVPPTGGDRSDNLCHHFVTYNGGANAQSGPTMTIARRLIRFSENRPKPHKVAGPLYRFRTPGANHSKE